ncbi:hypothetical protein HRbin20_01421 [bacterium HR20]|nr:hypothetical protein HRbin20_01421 [bacterium HR20]
MSWLERDCPDVSILATFLCSCRSDPELADVRLAKLDAHTCIRVSCNDRKSAFPRPELIEIWPTQVHVLSSPRLHWDCKVAIGGHLLSVVNIHRDWVRGCQSNHCVVDSFTFAYFRECDIRLLEHQYLHCLHGEGFDRALAFIAHRCVAGRSNVDLPCRRGLEIAVVEGIANVELFALRAVGKQLCSGGNAPSNSRSMKLLSTRMDVEQERCECPEKSMSNHRSSSELFSASWYRAKNNQLIRKNQIFSGDEYTAVHQARHATVFQCSRAGALYFCTVPCCFHNLCCNECRISDCF